MSYRLKDTTIENGFVRNPDRVYYEDFFNQLPLSSSTFSLPNTAGDIDLIILQPENTYIKDIQILPKTAPVILRGDCGISIDSIGFKIMGQGNIISGSANNIINDTTTLTQLTTISITGTGTNVYTSISRRLFVKITTSTDLNGSSGSLNLVPTFVNPDTSLYTGSRFFNFISSNTSSGLVKFDNQTTGMTISTGASNYSESKIYGKIQGSILSKGVLLTDAVIDFETSIILPSVDSSNISLYTGLKVNSDFTINTDTAAAQAFFAFGDRTPLAIAGNHSGNLLFIYSADNKNFVTDLGLSLKANTLYNLKIKINKYRKLQIFVNGIQYGVTSSDGATPNIAANSYDINTSQLNDSTAMYPIVGIKNVVAEEMTCIVNYVKCSRSAAKIT